MESERAASFDAELRRRVRAHVRAYTRPDDAVAWRHLVAALGLFGAGLAAHATLARRLGGASRAAWASPDPAHVAAALALGVALGIVVVVQAATFIKLFMLHHDMMHGAFFSRAAWHWPAAVVVGSLIHVSPTTWKREHDRHHRTSNDLDHLQDGQTASFTVERYRASPWWVRAAYRVGNDPRVLFSVVPLAYFVVFMRVRARWQENVAVCALWLGLWKLGLAWAHTIPMALAASLGFLMFHAQHTFEGCYRRRGRAWSAFDNGMLGSSLLVLPGGRVLGPAVRFFAHGVEYHHAHHLSPKIPGYRLAACHAEAGALFDACPRVTLRQALATASYNLYDEARGRFVDVRRLG